MPPQRRLSSRVVQVGMIGALSMTLVACSSKKSTADCVDGDTYNNGGYSVVGDSNCTSSSTGRYFWYYNGANNGGFVSKGTTLKPKKGAISSRGGFGIRSGSSGG